MKSWKTTVSGLITAIGAALMQNDDATLKLIGQILIVLGPILFGLSAKDAQVHGGTIAQATPAAVQVQTAVEGAELTAKTEADKKP